MRLDRRRTISFSRPLWSAVALAVVAGGCAGVEDWTGSLAFRDYPDHRHRTGSSRIEAVAGPESALAQTGRDMKSAPSNSNSSDSVALSNEPTEQVASHAEGSSSDADAEALHLTTYQPLQDAPPLLPGRKSPEGGPASEVPRPQAPLPATAEPADDRYPINLGTALQLAGASNLQISLATEQVREALARLDLAELLWVPDINAGLGYNSHVGQIQATEGDVVEVNRESFFFGGGPLIGDAPLTGLSGGPPRLFLGLSPVEVYFEPLAARQAVAAAQASEAAAFNDTLLEVTETFFELVQAQGEVAIAREAVRYAERLVELTEQFAETGAGLEADAVRARAELAGRRRRLLAAEEELRVVSAELARLLRLEPDLVLHPVDMHPMPLPLFPDEESLSDLIAQGLAARPELAEQSALVNQTLQEVRQEEWRPWVPQLYLGMSSGVFGGGPDDTFNDFSDRTDFDALVVWELKNLGLGNAALQRRAESRHRQAHLTYQQTIDQVEAQITQAYRRVRYGRKQLEQAEAQVQAATRAIPLNFRGIRGRVLRPIEALQAIDALASGWSRYLDAVISYNQAQFALLHAVGRPPEAPESLSAEASAQR